MLLATKFFIPQPHASTIARPRLLDMLTDERKGKVVLISAPAGFGKTTLVVGWIHKVRQGDNVSSPLAVGWLALDENDNDPMRFFAYLTATLQRVDATIGQSVQTLLSSPETPPPESLVILLLNDIAMVRQPFVLVLDDYHVITNEAIHQAISFLVEQMPAVMKLVISTRTDPPLPLPRWRVRRMVTEIRQSALRFTEDETAALLHDALGVALPQADVKALETRTEGWIAGLQLAALSMQDREDAHQFVLHFSGSNVFIIDYLMEEVLQRQSQEMQQFLLQTSILERLCAPLCETITGYTNGQALLEQLQRANLFLIPLDDERRWYRYHHLFADVLRHRLQHLQPDQRSELNRRAAEWFAQNGWPQEAIHHALVAEAFGLAATLIEQYADAFVKRGEYATLRNWFQQLPTAFLDDHPALRLVRAKLFALQHQLHEAERDLDAAEQTLQLRNPVAQPHTRDAPVVGAILVARTQIALLRGDAAKTTELAHQALAVLPKTSVLRGEVLCELGVAQMWQGNLDSAGVNLAEAARLCEAENNISVALRATYNLAALHHLRGQPRQVAQVLPRIVQLAESHGVQQIPMLGFVYSDWSELWYEWNDLDRASQAVETAIEFGRRYAVPRLLASCYVTKAVVAWARGDRAGANEAIQTADHLIKTHHLPLRYETPLTALRVRLWLAQDNLAAAGAWAATSDLDVEGELIPLHDNDYLTLARVWLAQGQYARAERLLTKLYQSATAVGRQAVALDALILQSRIALAKGDNSRAFTQLTAALTLAEPEGYIRTFVDQGATMGEFLVLYRRQNEGSPSQTYVEKLLAAFGPLPSTVQEKTEFAASLAQTAVASSPSSLIEPLSVREMEVLHLVAEGLSNNQIAERLIVTVGTVKRHLNNIFGKLGVNSRTQALARAKEYGLFQ